MSPSPSLPAISSLPCSSRSFWHSYNRILRTDGFCEKRIDSCPSSQYFWYHTPRVRACRGVVLAGSKCRKEGSRGVVVEPRKNKCRPSPWHPNSFPISTIIHALSLLSNYPSRPFLFHLYQYCIGCTMPKKSGRSENTRWRRNCGKIQARG